MPDLILVLLIAIIILLIIYFSMILGFIRGWHKVENREISNGNKFKNKLSVLIPFRNEAAYIESILNDLNSKGNSAYIFEIILINDHSEDGSFEIAAQAIKNHPKIKLLDLPDRLQGKKAALHQGLQSAGGNIVATLDADVQVPGKWGETICKNFDEDTKALILPVAYTETNALFNLDFIALQAVTFGSLGNEYPTLSNGANAVYDKEALNEIGGFETSAFKSSGDDLFTLMAIIQKYGDQFVAGILRKEVLVLTPPPVSFKEFFSQRLRWAGKTTAVKNRWFTIVAWLVLLTNLGLAVLFIACFFVYSLIIVFLILFILKMLIDFFLLKPALSFYGKRKLLLWYIPASFMYLFYVSLLSIFSRFLKPSWKGRKIQ